MVIQCLTWGTRVGHVQHVGVVSFLFNTGVTSNQAVVFYLFGGFILILILLSVCVNKSIFISLKKQNPLKVLHLWSLHEVEIRGELHAEQKQSQSGSVTQVEKSWLLTLFQLGLFIQQSHMLKVLKCWAGLILHGGRRAVSLCCRIFIIFILSYLMGTVSHRSVPFLLPFKAVVEFGVYNMKRCSPFPRAGWSVSR